MKAKLLIIGFLIVCLICAFTFTGQSQTYVYGSKEGNISKVVKTHNCIYEDDKQIFPIKDTTYSPLLIGDETWMTQLKTGAKIVTYSESIFRDVSLRFGSEFKRISIVYKRDRHGTYKEYTIYLTQEVANNIKEWAKTNL